MKMNMKKVILTASLVGGMISLSETIKADATQITTIGDSISAGWVKSKTYCEPYGKIASNQLGMTFKNVARAGNSFVPKSNNNNYFSYLINQNKETIKQANVIFILEGTNDYGYSSPFKKIKEKMIQDLKTIKSLNPKAKIIGILPLERWDKADKIHSDYYLNNQQQYDLMDIINLEKQVYQSLNIEYTTFNEMGYTLKRTDTVDSLHPSPATHQKMGAVLAKKVSQLSKGSKASGYVVPMKDTTLWRNLDFSSKKGTAKKNTTYKVKWQYKHINGKKYLSLYNNKDEWQGYIQENQVKSVNIGGVFHRKEQKVTFFRDTNYYRSTKFNHVRGKIDGHQTLKVKGYYRHFNGTIYQSVYDNKDQWLGYVKSNDVRLSDSKGGSYVGNSRQYITVKSTDYHLLSNLSTGATKRVLNNNSESFFSQAHYHHLNGRIYYSLYKMVNGQQVWQGYMNKNNLIFNKDDFGKFHYAKVNQKAIIKRDGYGIYKDKLFKKKVATSNQWKNKTYYVKGYYQRIMNERKYYSLYNSRNQWIGYINENACVLK